MKLLHLHFHVADPADPGVVDYPTGSSSSLLSQRVYILVRLGICLLYVPVNNFQSCRDGSSWVELVFKAEDEVGSSRTQCSASGEA